MARKTHEPSQGQGPRRFGPGSGPGPRRGPWPWLGSWVFLAMTCLCYSPQQSHASPSPQMLETQARCRPSSPNARATASRHVSGTGPHRIPPCSCTCRTGTSTTQTICFCGLHGWEHVPTRPIGVLLNLHGCALHFRMSPSTALLVSGRSCSSWRPQVAFAVRCGVLRTRLIHRCWQHLLP